MRLFITGATGQLGSAMVARFADCDLVRPRRTELDLTAPEEVERAVRAARPDLIINCAAYNYVDAAEDFPDEAMALNAGAVETLARAADAVGATLVHFGSDFVFDGEATAPYEETAPPAPQSRYGTSKLRGEQLALTASRSYVLRVESLFGASRDFPGRTGSMESILRGLQEGREIAVFNDRVVTPGYVVDIAAATRHLLTSRAPYGLYHCANAGPVRWTELAEGLASLLGVTPAVRPVSSTSVSLKARRPLYSALSTAKLAATGHVMPSWRDALRRWIESRSAVAA